MAPFFFSITKMQDNLKIKCKVHTPTLSIALSLMHVQ